MENRLVWRFFKLKMEGIADTGFGFGLFPIWSALDEWLLSSNAKLITSLYSKPTDCHQYLHYGSCNPEHTKMSKSKFNVDRQRSNNRQKKGIPFTFTFHPNLRFSKTLTTIFIYYTWMMRLELPLHLNLWFYLGVPAKSIVIW